MKTSQEWESLKHEIRSILVSCKIAIPVRELNQHFKRMTGTPIKFEKFGYPDVFNTIWHNGELRLVCKRNPKDITVEALNHVVKHGKQSKNFGIGPNISIENQIEICIAREWQDKIEDIILKNSNGTISIDELSIIMADNNIQSPNERLTLVGSLRRCWNFNVNKEKTNVSIFHRNDPLKLNIEKLLNVNPNGILLDEFEDAFYSYFQIKLDTKIYGFGCALSMFRYYSKNFTICACPGGFLRIFSKNFCVKLSAVSFKTNCEFLGIIKCVNNPTSFWVVPYEHPILKEVADEIINLKNSCEILEAPKPGDIALAHSLKFNIPPSRCLIIDVNNHITVFFVDHGVVDIVERENIICIPQNSKLLEFPRLAIHTKLDKVRPNGKKWCSESIKYFYNCLANKLLLVTVITNTRPPVPVRIKRLSKNPSINVSKNLPSFALDVAEDMAMHKYLVIEKLQI